MAHTDETLMAYVDGELDPQARAGLEAQLAVDPQLVARVQRHRDLRARLHAAFDNVVQEPVPQSLVAAARDGPAGLAPIARLAEHRNRAPRASRWPSWSALAASVLVGLVLGAALFRGPIGGSLMLQGGQLLARGSLRTALDTQLAQDRPQRGAQVGLSFVARSGDYCRTFTMPGEQSAGQPLSGVACRSGGQWQVQAAIRLPAAAGNNADGGLRMASSSIPEALAATVDALRAGDPLDADAERQAVQRGWNRP